MPIYEYECRKCKAHTEIMQKMTDKPLTRCRKCGGRLEKQWSSTSFQLKGSGWYVTDYAGKKTEAKEDTKKEETKKTDAKEEKTARGEKKGASESTTAADKATPKEAASSKKSSTSKTAPSSGD